MAKKQEKSPMGSKKRRIIIIVGIILLVLLAGGAGVALRWWQQSANNGESMVSDQEEEVTETLPAVVDDLQNLRIEGNQAAFDQDIQVALDNPDYDDPTRASIYIQQGSAAYDKKNFQAALEAYMNAEDLVHTSETAQLVGFTQEELGDKAKAIEYYQLTIDRLSPDNVLYEADKQYFEERINLLR
jgi:tetratricopeptide (TPR) repeat protein